MSKYRGPQPKVVTVPEFTKILAKDMDDSIVAAFHETAPIPPAPLGFLPKRMKRFLCFECLHHAPFLSREALKAHMEGGHRD